jgi:L-aspartate oxidase
MKSLMWRHAGVERDAAGLAAASEQLTYWSDVTDELSPATPQAWELRNMLLIARTIVMSAATRQESRGVQFRTDFPSMNATPTHTELHVPHNLDGNGQFVCKQVAIDHAAGAGV